MRRATGRGAALVASAAVLVAACSSGAKPLPVGTPAEQRAAAATALVRSTDLKGWSVSPAPPSGASTTLTQCLRVDPSVLGGDGSARAIASQGSSQVTDTVSYSLSGFVASQAWQAISGRRLEKCVHAVLEQSLQDSGGALILGYTSHRTAPRTGLLSSLGLTADFTSSAAGSPDHPVHVDLVFAQRGRICEELEFIGVGQPFDPALEARLVSTLGKRFAGLPGGR